MNEEQYQTSITAIFKFPAPPTVGGGQRGAVSAHSNAQNNLISFDPNSVDWDEGEEEPRSNSTFNAAAFADDMVNTIEPPKQQGIVVDTIDEQISAWCPSVNRKLFACSNIDGLPLDAAFTRGTFLKLRIMNENPPVQMYSLEKDFDNKIPTMVVAGQIIVLKVTLKNFQRRSRKTFVQAHEPWLGIVLVPKDPVFVQPLLDTRETMEALVFYSTSYERCSWVAFATRLGNVPNAFQKLQGLPDNDVGFIADDIFAVQNGQPPRFLGRQVQQVPTGGGVTSNQQNLMVPPAPSVDGSHSAAKSSRFGPAAPQNRSSVSALNDRDEERVEPPNRLLDYDSAQLKQLEKAMRQKQQQKQQQQLAFQFPDLLDYGIEEGGLAAAQMMPTSSIRANAAQQQPYAPVARQNTVMKTSVRPTRRRDESDDEDEGVNNEVNLNEVNLPTTTESKRQQQPEQQQKLVLPPRRLDQVYPIAAGLPAGYTGVRDLSERRKADVLGIAVRCDEKQTTFSTPFGWALETYGEGEQRPPSLTPGTWARLLIEPTSTLLSNPEEKPIFSILKREKIAPVLSTRVLIIKCKDREGFDTRILITCPLMIPNGPTLYHEYIGEIRDEVDPKKPKIIPKLTNNDPDTLRYGFLCEVTLVNSRVLKNAYWKVKKQHGPAFPDKILLLKDAFFPSLFGETCDRAEDLASDRVWRSPSLSAELENEAIGNNNEGDEDREFPTHLNTLVHRFASADSYKNGEAEEGEGSPPQDEESLDFDALFDRLEEQRYTEYAPVLTPEVIQSDSECYALALQFFESDLGSFPSYLVCYWFNPERPTQFGLALLFGKQWHMEFNGKPTFPLGATDDEVRALQAGTWFRAQLVPVKNQQSLNLLYKSMLIQPSTIDQDEKNRMRLPSMLVAMDNIARVQLEMDLVPENVIPPNSLVESFDYELVLSPIGTVAFPKALFQRFAGKRISAAKTHFVGNPARDGAPIRPFYWRVFKAEPKITMINALTNSNPAQQIDAPTTSSSSRPQQIFAGVEDQQCSTDEQSPIDDSVFLVGNPSPSLAAAMTNANVFGARRGQLPQKLSSGGHTRTDSGDHWSSYESPPPLPQQQQQQQRFGENRAGNLIQLNDLENEPSDEGDEEEDGGEPGTERELENGTPSDLPNPPTTVRFTRCASQNQNAPNLQGQRGAQQHNIMQSVTNAGGNNNAQQQQQSNGTQIVFNNIDDLSRLVSSILQQQLQGQFVGEQQQQGQQQRSTVDDLLDMGGSGAAAPTNQQQNSTADLIVDFEDEEQVKPATTQQPQHSLMDLLLMDAPSTSASTAATTTNMWTPNDGRPDYGVSLECRYALDSLLADVGVGGSSGASTITSSSSSRPRGSSQLEKMWFNEFNGSKKPF